MKDKTWNMLRDRWIDQASALDAKVGFTVHDSKTFYSKRHAEQNVTFP